MKTPFYYVPALFLAMAMAVVLAMPTPALSSPAEYVEGQVIVRFKDSAANGQAGETLRKSLRDANMVVRKSYGNLKNLFLLQLPPGKDVTEAVRELSGLPSVQYAEPNIISRLDNTYPSEKNYGRFSEQWGLQNTGQAVNGGASGVSGIDMNAPAAWDVTTGSTNVVVGIIDTGIDYNHDDLKANVDLAHSYNALNGTSDPTDQTGHGTAVAGVIGAAGNNASPPSDPTRAITGVNWTVSLASCVACNASGCTLSGQLACMDYFYTLKATQSVNIVAINGSFGDYTFSQARYDAIKQLMQAGIVYVASAGNNGVDGKGNGEDSDAEGRYPCSYGLPNIICVASVDNTGKIAGSSNYGRHSVSVFAPGTNILSTSPGNVMGFSSGTSFAAPFVTGLAALVKSANPSFGWVELKNLIMASGKYMPSAYGYTLTDRLIRAWDTGGGGALSCTNSIVKRRMKPVTDTIDVIAEDVVALSVLNVNCSRPNGEVILNVSDGSQVILKDDGTGFDDAAGDGVYSGSWSTSAPGTYTIEFPFNPDDNTAFVPEKVTVVVRRAVNYRVSPVTGTYYTMQEPETVDLSSGNVKEMDIPFNIPFGDSAAGYSKVYIYGGGVMSFTDGAITALNQPLPYAKYTTVVAPFWDVLTPLTPSTSSASGGGVYMEVSGTPPARNFIVEWRNLGRAGTTKGVTFQAVFTENSPTILFNYKAVQFGDPRYDAGAAATVGIQVSSGTSGSLARQWSYNGASLSDSLSLAWEPDNRGSPFVRADFNGDGKEDILWRSATYGTLGIGVMNGTAMATAASVAPSAQWNVAGIGDFNGDGKSDILFRNPNTGDIYLWLMDGGAQIGGGLLGSVDTAWQIAGIGDFDGDGKADILGRNTVTGDLYVLLMDGATPKGGGFLSTTPGLNWEITGIGDFNGDGRSDILWRNPSTGELLLYIMNGTVITGGGSAGTQSSFYWHPAGTCDFDGDGKRDILWENASTGELRVWFMDGTAKKGEGSIGFLPEMDWQIAALGDFNGDGRCDILGRHYSSGLLYVLLLNGTTGVGGGFSGTIPGRDWTTAFPGVQ